MKPTVFSQNCQFIPPFPLPPPHSQELTKFYGFHKYLQAYTTAFHFHYQIKLFRKKQHELLSRIITIENNLEKNQPHCRESSQSEKPKRKRRLAGQIERSFVCPQQKCAKNYGTLGSLQQHMRLKHPERFPKEEGDRQPQPKQEQELVKCEDQLQKEKQQ